MNAINSARRPSRSTGNPPSQRTAATGVPRNKGSGPGQRRESHLKCKFCLKTHEKKKESCFAWNKFCNTCGISNHFSGSSVCRGKKKTGSGVVHTVEEFSDEDDYFFHIESPNTVHRKIFASNAVTRWTNSVSTRLWGNSQHSSRWQLPTGIPWLDCNRQTKPCACSIGSSSNPWGQSKLKP